MKSQARIVVSLQKSYIFAHQFPKFQLVKSSLFPIQIDEARKCLQAKSLFQLVESPLIHNEISLNHHAVSSQPNGVRGASPSHKIAMKVLTA